MEPVYRDGLCRFCLCSGGDMINLFRESNQHGFIIEETIEDLLRIKVTKEDGFSPLICQICLTKLDNFRVFKCQCDHSRIEYMSRYFGKGNLSSVGDIQSLSSDYSCIKQEPDAPEDFVPCEVSIKTEHEELELSPEALVFGEAREMSDENFSEAEDEAYRVVSCEGSESQDIGSIASRGKAFGSEDEGENFEEAGRIQVEGNVPANPSYFSQRTSDDHNGSRSEMPQRRKSWDKASMIRAVEAVMNKEMSLLKASKAFNVPRSTIKDYAKKNGKNSVYASIGRKPVLPVDVEEELVHFCEVIEKAYFGLTPRDVEKMAYNLATRNGLKHPFSDTKQAAGRKWVKQFFRRHSNLTYHKPQTLMAARIAGFTRINVDNFFSLLEPELVKINFSPERLYSVDETGLTVLLEKSVKVLCVKGRGQVELLSLGERRNLVSILSCMSASGQFVPPLMVFPFSEGNAAVSEGLPAGTVVCHDDSNWILPETFNKWLRHFVTFVKASTYDPVVLVIDAHYFHNRNIDVMEFARSNGVLLVCLPPHSTHKMNPVQVSFIWWLRTYYCQEVERWRTGNGGVAMVTERELPVLLGKAYRQSATVEVAANGYWKTGICPFQRDAFGDHDFSSNSKDMESRVDVSVDHGIVSEGLESKLAGTSGNKHLALLSATSPYA